MVLQEFGTAEKRDGPMRYNKKLMPVIVPISLLEQFKKECDKEYKTVSEVIRDFMFKFIQEKKK
jgi:hypothetical protein